MESPESKADASIEARAYRASGGVERAAAIAKWSEHSSSRRGGCCRAIK